MAKNPTYPNDKTPASGAREELYLGLWEENIRLLCANGPTAKPQTKND